MEGVEKTKNAQNLIDRRGENVGWWLRFDKVIEHTKKT